MKKINFKKYNTQLILSFLCVSVIPILIVSMLSYYIGMRTIRNSMNEMIEMNLKQTQNSLEIWLDSYEDILFQLYTDEDVIALVEDINNQKDTAVARSQLKRKLRSMFFTKDYVKAITIISRTGEIIDYDMLVSSTEETSWMDHYDMSREELYEKLSDGNKVKILPTEYATTFANEEYYLFHIGNRLINYKKPDQDIGVIIVSIDEKLLQGICLTEDEDSNKNNFHFLVDNDGNIISYIDTSKIHLKISDTSRSNDEKLQDYLQFIKQTKEFEKTDVSVSSCLAQKPLWNIVHVSNQEQYVKELRDKQKLIILVIIVSMLGVVMIITLLSRKLTQSINRIVEAIKRAGTGNLSEPIAPDKRMPEEIETIAVQFNHMLEELDRSMTREKKAYDRQRIAEIAALEAQINPHFIYNTLDTINWMAIDHDEYEISNAINALAKILRYGIDNSNGVVTIREEAEWLKQYIFLQ
ncbi:MAG TPA: histidine kinase [Lachnospiraceae bacterium]|nr:histidine kinase [Lachnospiraceae bacterium]